MKQNTIRCTLLFIILVFVFSCNAKAETVKDEIISLAKSGEGDAQFLLGYVYFYGKEGVSQDFDKAFYWFNAAAKKVQTDDEHYNALVFHLGLCYYDGLGTEENYNQAVRWFKLGANRGDALSQYYLGLCYYDGLGVEEDAKKAFEWYLKSAEQDCVMAQCSLGVLYLNGDGVPKDEKQGVYWLSIAADKGDAEAQTNLAFYYLVDKQDKLKAYKLLFPAAEKGYAEAQWALGSEYRKNKDYDNALKWLKKAADQDHAEAQAYLGSMYDNGDGVPKDLTTALHWYLESTENGCEEPVVQYRIGKIYYDSKNFQEAAKWLNMAASQGFLDAQYRLGYMYQYGQGVKKNYETAFNWYDEALTQLSEKEGTFWKDYANEIIGLIELMDDELQKSRNKDFGQDMRKYSALNGVWHLSTNRNRAIRITLYPSSGSVKFELWVGRAGVQWVEYPDAHYVSPGQIYVNGGADFGKVTFRLSGSSLVGSNGRTYYK